MQNIEEVRHKIEWWSSYVEQHERIYSSCHMNNAWHKRMANIKQNIFNWRMKEIEMVQNNPSLYRRKTKLIENLLNQLEYHQCEKERIVRKAYAGKEELDFSMVNHH